MNDPLSAGTALIVFLAVTASILGMTLMWATANRRPVRPHHRQLRDRPVLPHAHTRVGSPDVSGTRSRTVASPPTVPTSGA
jgi:hypothetical protein